ncbi:MAG: ribokinase [Acetobacteraceae bacterium]|nr:ribokinase [Acetobacteraceae bacterium]
MLVVFGSINLDLIFPLQTLPTQGDTVFAGQVRIEPGGRGANQAVAAARDGARVLMAGAVGRDVFAEEALAGLRRAGVDLGRVLQLASHTGCAAICRDKGSGRMVVGGSGANMRARASQVEDRVLGPLTTFLCQRETDPAEIATLIRRAKARGARVIINLAPPAAIPNDAMRAADLVVVNKAEGGWLGTHLGTAVNAPSLRAALGVDVVRTMGAEGSELATASGYHRIPELPVKPVDTSGAGDCFVGVLAAALDRGLALLPALHRATVAAGVCCTRTGNQNTYPSAGEIDVELKHYRPERK